MKRRYLEFEITFFAYLLIAAGSGIIAFAVLRAVGKITQEFYVGNTILNAFIPLIFAELLNIAVTLSGHKYAFEKMTLWGCIRKSLRGSVGFAAAWAVILVIAKTGVTRSRYFFLFTVFLNFLFLTAYWYFAPRQFAKFFYKTASASMVGVIAPRKEAAKITDTLKKDWARRVVGIALTDEDFRMDPEQKIEIDHVPVMADQSSLISWAQLQALDEVFVIIERQKNIRELMPDVREMVKMGIQVHVNVPVLEQISRQVSRMEEDGYVPVIDRHVGYMKDGRAILTMSQPQMRMRGAILKRALDIVGGIIGLAITAVLFVVLGIAIKLDSPGPVIFAQERIGKNGRHFKMYKFRSMYEDAEERKKELMKDNEMKGQMFKIDNDPRITRVGRFIRRTSLDEFPQFLNVLKGDMSLVGTRPPTVGEFQQYNSYHKRRLAMKPGITGMWQVSGRSDIKDFEEVVRLDCRYIDNWSLGLDFKILMKTVGQLFTHKGAE